MINIIFFDIINIGDLNESANNKTTMGISNSGWI